MQLFSNQTEMAMASHTEDLPVSQLIDAEQDSIGNECLPGLISIERNEA